MTQLIKLVKTRYNELGLILAMGATLASIALSEIYEFIPCELCWYQRIAMFGLAAVFLVATLINDKKSQFYAIPFLVAGLAISFYQSLLQWGIIKEISTCSIGVPCSEAEIKILGIFTIPFGAFIVFLAITFITWLKIKQSPIKLKRENLVKTLNISLLMAVAFLVALLAQKLI